MKFIIISTLLVIFNFDVLSEEWEVRDSKGDYISIEKKDSSFNSLYIANIAYHQKGGFIALTLSDYEKSLHCPIKQKKYGSAIDKSFGLVNINNEFLKFSLRCSYELDWEMTDGKEKTVFNLSQAILFPTSEKAKNFMVSELVKGRELKVLVDRLKSTSPIKTVFTLNGFEKAYSIMLKRRHAY